MPTVGQMADELIRALLPHYVDLIRMANADVAAVLGVAIPYNPSDPAVKKQLDELMKLAGRIAETTSDEARKVLVDAAASGMSLFDTIAQLHTAAEQRAAMIAITETMAAYNRGTLLAYKGSSEVDASMWLTYDPCPRCSAMTGKVVPLFDEFLPGFIAPPLHPSCRCALSPVRKQQAPRLEPGAFQTLDDATEWASAAYPNIAWDFEGAHIDTIQPTLIEFDSLAKKYPQVAARLEYIGTYQGKNVIYPNGFDWSKQGGDAIAHANLDGRYMGLNPKYYGDPLRMQNAFEFARQTGFLHKGTTGPAATMSHEFGHLLDGFLRLNGDAVLPYASADGLGFVGETLTLWRKQHKPTKSISIYATTNSDEAFAESFSAMIHLPRKQWPAHLKKFETMINTIDPANHLPGASVQWLHQISDRDERDRAIEMIRELRERLGLK